ncbi:short-chain dehydrogenase reductase ATA1 isoform X2 [Cryptomeria japonica]|uniref:short-chain dehydrogenase reductase ATA1 isoform X2 n=1 Tax=Cryptomeria japonica TaxID=3369 RepID=UPI0027D9DBEF|nr:short-chain dehydrogenase reductase ATA1 isoform X2 [Cryptomeria japonica]
MAANGKGDELLQVPTSRSLEGKVAIITGAARGIGAACAKKFAENGAKVIVADILDEVGRKLCTEIIPSAEYIHCDVSKEEEVAAMVERAVKDYGRLDIMFNNAGVPGQPGSIMNIDMKRIDTVLAINVKGTVNGIKHAARAMVAAKRGGCILCTTSSAALMGGLGFHDYSMSKEAILGVARTAACELGEYGIRVNCISPHGVPSEMLVAGTRMVVGNHVTAQEVRAGVAFEGSLLQGRSATEEDIATAALFLATEEGGGFISGHNLVVDGGFTSAFRNMRFIYHPYFDNCQDPTIHTSPV